MKINVVIGSLWKTEQMNIEVSQEVQKLLFRRSYFTVRDICVFRMLPQKINEAVYVPQLLLEKLQSLPN